jgi:hypothetical protein
MAEGSQSRNPLVRLWLWTKGQIVSDVPEDIATCEFDCRKPQCTQGEWETCSRRLTRAAGERMPGSAQAQANPRLPQDNETS